MIRKCYAGRCLILNNWAHIDEEDAVNYMYCYRFPKILLDGSHISDNEIYCSMLNTKAMFDYMEWPFDCFFLKMYKSIYQRFLFFSIADNIFNKIIQLYIYKIIYLHSKILIVYSHDFGYNSPFVVNHRIELNCRIYQ